MNDTNMAVEHNISSQGSENLISPTSPLSNLTSTGNFSFLKQLQDSTSKDSSTLQMKKLKKASPATT